MFRVTELRSCGRPGRPGLPVSHSPYGLCLYALFYSANCLIFVLSVATLLINSLKVQMYVNAWPRTRPRWTHKNTEFNAQDVTRRHRAATDFPPDTVPLPHRETQV